MPIFALDLDGGVSTEAGPSAPFRLKGTGAAGETLVSVPWLIEAQNVIYSTDGWFQKMPGTANVNATATGATDEVAGIFDYWRSGSVGNPVQQRVIYAGTQIYTESGGTLTSRRTGLEAARMPWFAVANDVLVIATNSATDVPMSWDQTTFANLAGSPPNFGLHVNHRGYIFAAGVYSNKSRLYYSASPSVANNHADWTDASSGSIDVSPDDGDVITGLWSHKNELLIFKGPNYGSIWRLTGTAEASWALQLFFRGVTAVNQQSIIPAPGTDLWFWDDNGVHSLAATAAFGDYSERFLSAQISTYFRDNLNHNRFENVWGVNFASAGYALWTVSRAGSSTNDLIILLDYRFDPPRFAFWPAYAVASLAMIRDTSRLTIPWAGTYTGRVRRMNRATRNLAGTAYTARVLLPYLGFGDAFMDKTLQKGRVGFAPKGDTTFTIGWQRDGATQQTSSVSQAGAALLGDSSDNFVLDTDVLGGGRFLPAFFDMTGSFKEVQIEFTQGGLDVDVEPHSFAMDIESAGIGTTAVSG